ncbi:MAG TPA: lysylphosphatidylglycerol synthase domain-containing protein [Gaiellaceae bacterium]
MTTILGRPIRRSALVATGVLTLIVVVVAATPQLLGRRVGDAVGLLGEADPAFLWLAGLGFFCSLVGAAGSWRSAIGLCEGRLTLVDACTRYGVGSLVNTFVPARVGDAVRVALFSRALPHPSRVWSTGGACVAVGAARALVLAVLVVIGTFVGALPLWPVLVLGGSVALAVAVAVAVRGRRPGNRVSHAFDAFRGLGREPVAGLRIVGWVALSTVGRVGAAAAVAAALGVSAPLSAALIVVPALDLAGLMPLTPGNLGVTSTAVAMALQARGVGVLDSLASGIAFHAVETAVGISFGSAATLLLVGLPSGGRRRLVVAVAGASACAALLAAFGATVLVDLV